MKILTFVLALIMAGPALAQNYRDAAPVQGPQPGNTALVTNPMPMGVQDGTGKVQAVSATNPVPTAATGSAKGATASATATVTATGADHNSIDVIPRDGSGGVIGTDGTPTITKSKVLSDVFGRQTGPCVALNLTVSNASVVLPAGRYRVIGLANSGLFFRIGAVAVVDGTAEWLDKSQSVVVIATAETTLQALLPVGSTAAAPGIQACPRAE